MNADQITEILKEKPELRFANEELSRRILILQGILDVILKKSEIRILADINSKVEPEIAIKPNSP